MSRLRAFSIPVLAGGLLLSQMIASQAVLVNVGQYKQQNSNDSTLTYTGGAGIQGVISSVNVPVQFSFGDTSQFTSTNGFVPVSNVDYKGTLTISGLTNALGAAPAPNTPIDNFTLTITSTGNLGMPTGLTIFKETTGMGNADGGILVATNGQGSATLASSNPVGNPGTLPDHVTFYSSFFDLATGVLSQNGAISLSKIPGISYTSSGGGFPISNLNSFTAAQTGTFSADVPAVPEPGIISLMASMLVGGGMLRLRRRA